MTGTGTRPMVLDSSGGDRLFAQLGELRSGGAAVRVELPEGVVAWSVTRPDILRRLAAHPQVSRDARGVWPGYRPGAIAWLYPWVDNRSMATSEGLEHKRLRKMIGPAFGPRRLAALRPRIDAIVADLITDLETAGKDAPLDLRARYAHPLPTRLMCDLFGVPDEQRPPIMAGMDLVLDTGVPEEQARRIDHDLKVAMRTLLATKRVTPGDDMTSLLLTEHDGDRLTEEEMVATLLLMIGAGTQTAVALVVHAARALLRHPDQLAAVLADPAGWTEVIEETLRLHPPVVHLPLRFAREDIDLGDGTVIAAGDAIIMGFGAAGRDPGLHEHAEEFDIDRADKSHLAFGHGIHHCLGAPLARLEAAVALPALFGRFPRLALADPDTVPEPHHSFIANDIDALPVLLDGGPAR
ncbi:cytochrome P450 [Streptomyces sp. NPDC000594]|uniref:cytochrome P450 family protein n=1 Tax=Streptomyces sp. NPDC000594 TaxID=3154261 RepID=UPI00332D912D